MKWEDTPRGRLTTHVFNLINQYLQKYPIQDMDSRNALLKLRGVLVQSFEAFLQEPAIQKNTASRSTP